MTRKLPWFVGGPVGVLIARAATCYPNMQINIMVVDVDVRDRCLAKRVAFCPHLPFVDLIHAPTSTMMTSDAASLTVCQFWCMVTQPHAATNARSSIFRPVSLCTHESRRNGGKSLPACRVDAGGMSLAHMRAPVCGISICIAGRAVTGNFGPLQATAFHWPRLVIYLQARLRGLSLCSSRNLLSL
jgi:hypothetical protein